MILGWILGRIFCGGSSMEDSGVDCAMDSGSDLVIMESGVDSGSDLLWRILRLILLVILIQI